MQKHTTNETKLEFQFTKLCECGCGQPAPIAKETKSSHGHVAGKPMRFIYGHRSRVQVKQPIEIRFWSKVAKSGPDECWEWQASPDGRGYGQIKINRQGARAHRLAWELTNGPIPDGLFVLHKCDNPPCCNPNHLFLGTNNDNMQDMKQKGRAKSGGAHGVMMPQSKINESIASEIRRLYATHDFTQKQLGKKFGLSRGTVGEITRWEIWRHVTD